MPAGEEVTPWPRRGVGTGLSPPRGQAMDSRQRDHGHPFPMAPASPLVINTLRCTAPAWLGGQRGHTG